MSKRRNISHINAQKKGKEIDAYMCFFCLKVYRGNHGHHIIFFSEDGSPDTNNIITLCPECHRKYHSGTLTIEIGRF